MPLRDPDTGKFIARTYNVTVWGWEGDILYREGEATESDLQKIEEMYGDRVLASQIDIEENER